jgi:hypothetical protein
MITGRITGDTVVLLKLRTMGIRIRDAVRETVTRDAIALSRYVKEQKLSGQVLKNRTGTLRRKIDYLVSESPTSISGSVGVKLSYAAAHEYGIDKVVTVREHLREIKQAWGRPIAPMTVVVRQHPMHMHLPERSFLRSSLRENAPTIREHLRSAVAGAIK